MKYRDNLNPDSDSYDEITTILNDIESELNGILNMFDGEIVDFDIYDVHSAISQLADKLY